MLIIFTLAKRGSRVLMQPIWPQAWN